MDYEAEIARLSVVASKAEHQAALWDCGWGLFYRKLQCRNVAELMEKLQHHIHEPSADSPADSLAEAPAHSGSKPASSNESVSNVAGLMCGIRLGETSPQPSRSTSSQLSTASRQEQKNLAEIGKLRRDLEFYRHKAQLWGCLLEHHAELGFDCPQNMQQFVEEKISAPVPRSVSEGQLRRKLQRISR